MAITEKVITKNVEGWGRISLPEYLNWNRSGKGWGKMTLWHITTADRAERILAEGLEAGTCQQWMASGTRRPSAVYFFCDESVLDDMKKALFDDGVETVVVEVVIPADQAENICEDNAWNMEVEKAYMSAVKFLTDSGIPAKRIKKNK